MFGRSRPVVIDYYGRSRSRWRVPMWLVLLLVGLAGGAAGVMAVQERLLPPRLSADASAKLKALLEQTESERARLKAELDATTRRLETELAEKARVTEQMTASRQIAERANDDLAFLTAALAPDPRGGAVEIRAARFVRQRGALGYDVALYRERAAGKPMTGVIEFVVSGEAARGGETTVTSKPIPVSVTDHQVLRGSLPLPDGFNPRQSTIRVLDRAGGKLLGMRVLIVK